MVKQKLCYKAPNILLQNRDPATQAIITEILVPNRHAHAFPRKAMLTLFRAAFVASVYQLRFAFTKQFYSCRYLPLLSSTKRLSKY